MDLRSFLSVVARDFDPRGTTSSAVHDLLRAAQREIGHVVPPGYRISGHGGRGRPTFTPWIGVFNPRITDDPRRGLYLAYLFHADLVGVTLSLQQGSEEIVQEMGAPAARSALAQRALYLRSQIGGGRMAGLTEPISLASRGWRQRAYEAGSVAHIVYEVEDLPPETSLREDLERLIRILEACHYVESALPARAVEVVDVPDDRIDEREILRNFKPKSSDDYFSFVRQRTLRKERRHEDVLKRYGVYAATLGWSPNTSEHPIDLTLRPIEAVPQRPRDVLLEVKVVYEGNVVYAVREAIGQLLWYRTTYRSGSAREEVVLAAVFSEDIGEFCVNFLDDEHGVAAVWQLDAGGWAGSTRAREYGIV